MRRCRLSEFRSSYTIRRTADVLSLFITSASMSATFTRNGATVASLAPSGFTFTSTPETYNWNVSQRRLSFLSSLR